MLVQKQQTHLGKSSLLYHTNSDCGKIWLSPFLSFFWYRFFYYNSSHFSYESKLCRGSAMLPVPEYPHFHVQLHLYQSLIKMTDMNDTQNVTLPFLQPPSCEFSLPTLNFFQTFQSLWNLFLQEWQCFSQQVKLFPFQVFAEQLITMSCKSNDLALSEKQWKLFYCWECVSILIKCKIILITSNIASRIGLPFIQINEQTVQIPKQQNEMELSCLWWSPP